LSLQTLQSNQQFLHLMQVAKACKIISWVLHELQDSPEISSEAESHCLTGELQLSRKAELSSVEHCLDGAEPAQTLATSIF